MEINENEYSGTNDALNAALDNAEAVLATNPEFTDLWQRYIDLGQEINERFDQQRALGPDPPGRG